MATSGDCPRSESQEEEPAEYTEVGLLQEGVQPEEFVAIADYAATDETQLSFLRGEKILILRQTTADWWWGERAGCCGYIPANHVGKQMDEYDPEDTWQDEEYFGSYGTLKLHLEMLADQPRTTKYHSVILQNKESLTDKVILDVGCGTGIISLFCAHYARPKAVYAVEASEMAQHTGQLVLQNGFADIITVFQQKVEDVVLPEKVDVLVSEWMGTCLLAPLSGAAAPSPATVCLALFTSSLPAVSCSQSPTALGPSSLSAHLPALTPTCSETLRRRGARVRLASRRGGFQLEQRGRVVVQRRC
ncbi:protein arginine N-methyltransferase 2 isoform X2 [Saimiri boliviensis]|uniref:protein arginine N-methyltransferase 2 isoform X2 n=1 Tax=Saimiri boliviensis TaxID=27679 RepID=UPI003D77BFCC